MRTAAEERMSSPPLAVKFSHIHRSVHSSSPMSNRRRHIGTRDNPEPSKCLGVFGLSVHTTERQLYTIFDKFGPLEKVQVVLDSKVSIYRFLLFYIFLFYLFIFGVLFLEGWEGRREVSVVYWVICS